MGTIYKIVDASEPVFGSRNLGPEVVESGRIKKQLLFYGLREDTFPFSAEEYQEIKQLIDCIRHFKKIYLGKPKTTASTLLSIPDSSRAIS